MKAFVSHFDAGVDGADEEDAGKDDENADVQPEHESCSVENERKRRLLGSSSKPSLTPQEVAPIRFSGHVITRKLPATYFGKMMIWMKQMQQKTKRTQATYPPIRSSIFLEYCRQSVNGT